MKSYWTVLLLIASIASAQAEEGCPPGQIPAQAGGGVTSCGPISAGYYQQQQPAASRPSGEWIKTWGAISIGSIDSITNYGVTTGKLSKSEAEQDSLRRCASHGEDNCKVLVSYRNQCVALTEPQVNGLPSGVVSASGAATIAKASDISTADCKNKNKNTPQAQCKILYTACTDPIFHKY
jgi:hypothetical protein